MSEFDTAVRYILRNEGGLNESKHDRGGLTNFGISLRFLKTIPSDRLKKYGIFDIEITEETIRNLTIDQAKAIYKGEFWDHAPFEKIISQDYCNYIFDMAVNIGIAPAIKAVQRATWAVLKQWELIKDDGIMGDKTLAALSQCGFMIMPALRAERGAHYRAVIVNYPEQIENLRGWYDRTYHR